MREFIVKEYETFPYKGAVNELPQLIRCEKCKSRSEVSCKDILGFNLYRCLVHECYVMDRDFCSFAERRNNAE